MRAEEERKKERKNKKSLLADEECYLLRGSVANLLSEEVEKQ